MTSDDPLADGLERSLDPRVVPLERIVGWITFAPLALVTFVGAAVLALAGGADDAPLPWFAGAAVMGAWAAGAAALAVHTHRWPAISYRHSSYRLDDEGIEIRRGVFWQEIVNVPRSRVQHTDVSQGPLERRYGLGTLVIYTAGTDHARVALSGLDHGLALQIREHLLPRESGDAI